MCGIAGYKLDKPLKDHVIQSMVDALYHRGPDSSGFYYNGGYFAGMRRLSINDLVSGDQPLFNQDRSVVLFYNGEIYNSPELRRELIKNGFIFRTRSDGEVICHLYDVYGLDVFEKLDGMFAIAIWDKIKKRLILARDIPGEKPLYYSKLSEHEIVFASEINSLVKFPGLDLSLNQQALWDLPTFTWVPQPETIYKRIFSLPPSHFLVASNNGIFIKKYQNKFNSDISQDDNEDIIAQTKAVVTKAVESRLLSDVPIGSFLSSGLDSSIVSTLAIKKLPSLTTFTIGFEDLDDPHHGKVDESECAKKYAKTIGARHITIKVKADTFRNDMIKFCSHGGQPFAVPSGMGILAVSKAAKQEGIKVLLSGDCADECFGGYSWYPYLGMGNTKMSTTSDDANVTFNSVGLDLEKRLDILKSYPSWKRAWAWHYYASENEKEFLFNPDFFVDVKNSLRHFKMFKQNDVWQPEDYIRQDRECYLVNEMLQKLDRMTMAHSVEGRVPFASPEVLSHVNKLKYNQMVRGDDIKWVLRRSFSEILPKEIYTRPKHGFNVPIDHWLKGDWNDMFEETFSRDSQLTKMGLINRQSRDNAAKLLDDPIRVNGPTIFSLMILNIWLQEVYHGNNC